MDEIAFSFTAQPGWLRVDATGAADQGAIARALLRLFAEVRGLGARRLLVDLRGVSGDLTNLERYEIGVAAAEGLRDLERLAVVSAPGIVVNRHFEDVVNNRGLKARVFTHEEAAAAEEWLSMP
jgi:hypothetical protein